MNKIKPPFDASINHELAVDISRKLSALCLHAGESAVVQWDTTQILPGYQPAFCAAIDSEDGAERIKDALEGFGLIRAEHIRCTYHNPPYQAITGEKPYWLLAGRVADMDRDALDVLLARRRAVRSQQMTLALT